MSELKQGDFVFLDENNKPFLVKKWGSNNEMWLFYWHPDQHWVTLRSLSEHEPDLFPNNLSGKEQDMYMELHNKWEKRF